MGCVLGRGVVDGGVGTCSGQSWWWSERENISFLSSSVPRRPHHLRGAHCRHLRRTYEKIPISSEGYYMAVSMSPLPKLSRWVRSDSPVPHISPDIRPHLRIIHGLQLDYAIYKLHQQDDKELSSFLSCLSPGRQKRSCLDANGMGQKNIQSQPFWDHVDCRLKIKKPLAMELPATYHRPKTSTLIPWLCIYRNHGLVESIAGMLCCR